MEFIKTKCRKCGYEIEIPEKTEKLICGSCGNVNYFSKISSILKKYNETVVTDVSRQSTDKTIHSVDKSEQVKIHIPGDESSTAEAEEAEFPEEKNISKIMTVLFILAPFIAMAIEFFKLPSYAALLIIFLIIGIIFFLKK